MRKPVRRALPRFIFTVGVAVNILVCVPFLYDPFGWLDTPLSGATAQAEPLERVVFLRKNHDPVQVERFFQENPQATITHRGGLLGTLLVRIDGRARETLTRLKAQPFAQWTMRNSGVFCK